jgi:anti-sigma factor RsiW
MTQHLGELVAALVDGELDHETRDRAFAHISMCAQCRAEVDAQRRLKERVAGAKDLQPPAALTDRLLRLPETAEQRHLVPRRGFADRRRALRPIDPVRPEVRREHRALRRARYAAAFVGTLAVASVGTALIAGAPHQAPAVQPAVNVYSVDHAVTTGEVPLTDPAVGAAVVYSPGQSPSP